MRLPGEPGEPLPGAPRRCAGVEGIAGIGCYLYTTPLSLDPFLVTEEVGGRCPQCLQMPAPSLERHRIGLGWPAILASPAGNNVQSLVVRRLVVRQITA